MVFGFVDGVVRHGVRRLRRVGVHVGANGSERVAIVGVAVRLARVRAHHRARHRTRVVRGRARPDVRVRFHDETICNPREGHHPDGPSRVVVGAVVHSRAVLRRPVRVEIDDDARVS